MARSRYDVVVAGGGHNGLVAAAYLARAGQSVLVLERLDHVGGLVQSAEVFPGVPARLSRYSYLVSLLPTQIIRDLDLGTEASLKQNRCFLYHVIGNGTGADGRPCLEVKTPADLEAEAGLPGGHIWHGDLAWPFTDDESEVGGWGVETAHPRVLICGAGARRGGGVSGIGGHNAAMAILRGRRRRPRDTA